ncbi:MAG: carboxypeptidase-like regulatory domain-containing protein [Fodinibius sp.]|nr:carboxypeptidase-like regulatory domain-containing protein [Fodinibius sp.]
MLVTLLAGSFTFGYAQSYSISGTVVDKNGSPIKSADIYLSPIDNDAETDGFQGIALFRSVPPTKPIVGDDTASPISIVAHIPSRLIIPEKKYKPKKLSSATPIKP